MSERRLAHRVNFHAPSIVYLWVLRILVTLGAQQEFITEHVFTNDGLASVLGLNRDPHSPKRARAQLKKLHEAAERVTARTEAPARLALNVRRLRELITLSDCDCRILEFAVLIHTERLLDDTADMLGVLSSNKVYDVLAALLDLPASQVRASLGPQGILARAGLVSVSRSGGGLLRSKLDLLSENFADALAASYADPLTLLRGVVDPVLPAELTLKDFEHIQPVLKVLRPYLEHALAARRKGVNAFLHGPPGTGKSQFVRALAHALECDLFEVAAEDTDGDPISGERRLRAFRAAQTFFARRRALILFDEVEDVYNDGHAVFGQKSTAQTHKAWINRSLEENAVPTLWVSNTAEGIDAAFLRRFDLIFELAVPPRRQRERILATACGDLLNAGEIGRLAASDALAPAVATRAASIVRSIRAELPEEEVPKAFELIVGNTLRAQGHPGLSSMPTDCRTSTSPPSSMPTSTWPSSPRVSLRHARDGSVSTDRRGPARPPSAAGQRNR